MDRDSPPLARLLARASLRYREPMLVHAFDVSMTALPAGPFGAR
jgi:hypothetical protein